jgi:hypothetical protein
VRSLSGPLRPKPLLVAIHSPAQTADRVLAAWLSRTVPLLLKAAYPATQRLSAPVTSPHSQYGRRHRAVPPAWDGLTQTNNLGHSNQLLAWEPPGHPRPLSVSHANQGADRPESANEALNGPLR